MWAIVCSAIVRGAIVWDITEISYGGGGSSLFGNFSEIFLFFFYDGSPNQYCIIYYHCHCVAIFCTSGGVALGQLATILVAATWFWQQKKLIGYETNEIKIVYFEKSYFQLWYLYFLTQYFPDDRIVKSGRK